MMHECERSKEIKQCFLISWGHQNSIWATNISVPEKSGCSIFFILTPGFWAHM